MFEYIYTKYLILKKYLQATIVSIITMNRHPGLIEYHINNIVNPQITDICKNEKGGISMNTSGDARVNLFFKLTRDAHLNPLFIQWILESWCEDPLDTMKILFHLRDCRGGKGDRETFIKAMEYLCKNKYDWWLKNIEHVPTFGRYLDWFEIGETTSSDKFYPVIELICNQLKKDIDNMNQGKPVSLLAKWIPSEGKKWNRNTRVLKEIGKTLKLKQYYKEIRVEYLSPLRAYLNIVERLMCSNKWDEIDFSKVPSVAMNKLKVAFNRNCPEEFKRFKLLLSEGKTKINSSQIDPHVLVSQYYNYPRNITIIDQVIESQWDGIIEKTKKLGSLEKTIALVDVSGSMEGEPMMISIALGIIIATLSNGIFNNRLITFEEDPKFHTIPTTAKTLLDKINNLRSMSWGGNTNLYKVFDIILEDAKKNNLSQSNLPNQLIILSDMQFDNINIDNKKTQFELIDKIYTDNGYIRPKIIFWNLRSNTTDDFPVKFDENGTALISGYRTSILKQILSGVELTPYNIMRQAIDDERYNIIQAP